MSEEDKPQLSVLLPSARVALFTNDADSKQSCSTLEGDWRFARVTIEVFDGDVDTAISYYSDKTAHDLIIIQTEDIDDGFTSKLEDLAGYLSENTSAVVIGPVNDVNLYKKLSNMGVSDYLVKPITQDIMAEAIASTLIEQIGVSDSHLIAFLGAKGGVGTTMLSETLARYTADDLNQKTFLLDAAGGWSTISVGMDFDPVTTLAEAVRAASEANEDNLSRMVHHSTDRLHVLSSGGDVMLDDLVEAEQYEALLQYLMGLYPVVIVDLSASSAALRRTVLTKAHKTYIVTSALLPSVRATRTLLQEIREIRGGNDEDVDIILNMQGFASKSEVPKAQIKEGLERDPVVSIPFDPELFVSTESEAVKLGDQKAGQKVVDDLLAQISSVLSVTISQDNDAEKKMGIGQLLTKLKTKS